MFSTTTRWIGGGGYCGHSWFEYRYANQRRIEAVLFRLYTTMQKIAISLIKLYQYLLSPWLGSHCRFHPSCSQYAKEAIEMHGVGKGCWLSLRRLVRCQPWSQGGVDPVPTRKASWWKPIGFYFYSPWGRWVFCFGKLGKLIMPQNHSRWPK